MIEWNKKDLIEHKHDLIRYENNNNVDFSFEINETDTVIKNMYLKEIDDCTRHWAKEGLNMKDTFTLSDGQEIDLNENKQRFNMEDLENDRNKQTSKEI